MRTKYLTSSALVAIAAFGAIPVAAQQVTPVPAAAREVPPSPVAAPTAADAAPAAVATPGVEGDIIVTAQRRESTVRQVPFSIAAFSGDQLRSQQVFSPAALTQTVPGITINTSDKSLSIVAIRGNVSTFRTATLDTPVAFFLDDVYYIANNDLNANFYDTSRVEVLRGPQGTLFGRNVVGGAISVFTNNPAFKTDYAASITGGNAGYLRTEGMVNGVVLEDKLAARIAFSTERSDGLIKTPNQPGNFGEVDSESVRGKLLFTPTPTLKIVASADYSHSTGNGGSVQLMVGGNGAIPATFGNYRQEKWVNNDYARAPFSQRLRGGYLRGDLDLFGGALTSISGYRLNDSSSFLDNLPTGTVQPVFGLGQSVRNRSFTQEVRFASGANRLSYVVGAYFLSADVATKNIFDYSPLPGSSIGGAIPPNPRVTNITRQQSGHIRSLAAFGEFTFALTDRFSLAAGGRYTSDRKSVVYDAFSTTNTGPIAVFAFPGTVHAAGEQTWNAFTPRFTAKWKPIDEVNLYATYVKGFKSGGFVDNAYLNPTIPLNPEKATNIEIGAKSRFLDNKIDINVSVFRQETKNLQNFSGAGGLAHTYNGTSLAKGLELESVVRFTNNLRMNLNYSHIVGTYTSLKDPAVVANYSGNPIKYTPRDAVIVGGSYKHDLTNGALTLQSDFNFSTRVHTDDANTLPLYGNIYDATKGRTLNTRLTYDSADGRWSVGLWAKNVLNRYQVVLADDITSFLVAPGNNRYWKVFTNTPRTFGATLSFKK
ncbi:TonB-dependent receptor [Sphingomonas sp. AAP5]|uniref:TonB-dependent receptor n=1 Tax=Sphingomonas sp. AAP5 TaxID=1523415 RepID=UPI0010572953|nr:TonB-dependent receptor [Sphingomonas sp. AAP5]QBM75068.1 TonB-dependent receptor [Sphingomonas sp. AAP5]